MKHKLFSALKYLAAPLIVAALLFLAYGHLQAISDWAHLYDYSPPPAVTDLASQTTMTPLARRLFYINHPEIDDRSAFNSNCASQGEHTIVLGCYHPKDRGIYVFAVQDIRLEGVEQVTAAHEMLHAAYDRLSKSEKAAVDAELQDFYNNHLADQRIRDTMAVYQQTEPNDVVNEMHSIFGTEAAVLTPQLESYYKRYFTDRSKVTAYAGSYQAEFTGRTAQVKAYDQQLKDLKTQFDANSADLKQRQAALNSLHEQMDHERLSDDIAAYNRDVPIYNRQVDSYNAEVQTVKAEVAQYNDIVGKRNSLALEVQQLTQSIDSQFQQISQ